MGFVVWVMCGWGGVAIGLILFVVGVMIWCSGLLLIVLLELACMVFVVLL